VHISFAIVENGEITADSGTSASGPVVAAIVSLLNDYRISNGQPPLGFLNPWLYSKGYQGLNDILKGQSEGCIGRGFNASTGWDPVTGTPTLLSKISRTHILSSCFQALGRLTSQSCKS